MRHDDGTHSTQMGSWGKTSLLGKNKSGLVAKSCPTLVTPWAVAHWAPLSMGISRQEYCSALPFYSADAFKSFSKESFGFGRWANALRAQMAGSLASSLLHLELLLFSSCRCKRESTIFCTSRCNL